MLLVIYVLLSASYVQGIKLFFSISFRHNIQNNDSRVKQYHGKQTENPITGSITRNSKTSNNNEEKCKHFVRQEINIVNNCKSGKENCYVTSTENNSCLDVDQFAQRFEKDIVDEGVKMNSSCCSSESSSSLASSMMSSESHQNINLNESNMMSQSNSSNDIIDEEIDEQIHNEEEISEINLNTKLDNTNADSKRDMRLHFKMANANGVHSRMEKEIVTTPNNNTSLTFGPSAPCSEATMIAGIAQPASAAASMSSTGNATCTFSRTFPNCGTYFFKHVSSAEEEDDEDDLNDNDTLSTSLLSSSSPTPRPIGEDDTNLPPIVTSSPLKLDSSRHPPDFDLDDDDDDEDLSITLDRNTLFSAGLSFSDDLNITDGNGRVIPILDFSNIDNEAIDIGEIMNDIIDSPESSRRKRDIKKLVGDAEKLLFQTVSFTSDESEVDQHEDASASEIEQYETGAASASELTTCYQSSSRKNSINFPQLTRSSEYKQHNCHETQSSSSCKRSHSFHNYDGSYNVQSNDETKQKPTNIIVRRRHSNKGWPNLISRSKKPSCNQTNKNVNHRNMVNVNNNNNDYGCDASGEGRNNI